MIKSAEELEWLSRAEELTDLASAALRDNAAQGQTEHDLAAIVEGAAYLPGGGNYIRHFSVTPAWTGLSNRSRRSGRAPGFWRSGTS